ncbi:flagellin [Phaeospirillum tilakii]|uniref:Flagellin n=1 Tax=Phaeospirillum tilakii TaxID=741673 RepID=A0ABW5CG27_9PROT
MPVIATNTASNTALRYLNLNSSQESSTLSKLASGSRIVRASDDAAGLAIGSRIKSDVTSLGAAATNASQAQSILQIADGGLARIGDILQRMKALAVQADSGTVTATERSYIASEFTQLQSEIDTIASATRYNNQSLLNGTPAFASAVNFMVGTSTSDTISIQISSASASTLGVNSISVGGSTTTAAVSAISALDSAISTISQMRASVGATESRFEFQSQAIATSNENLSAAQSVIMDADVADQKSKLSSQDVKTQAAIAALTQANQLPQNLLSLLKS